MKKKRKKKLTTIPRLIKLAHVAWSKAVRARDGRCLMCGTTESNEAHHGIVPQKRGNSTRFLFDNGFTLCWYEHKIVYHKGLATKQWLDKWKSIVDSMVSTARQDEIVRISHDIKKYDRSELEEIAKFYTELAATSKGLREQANLRLIEP